MTRLCAYYHLQLNIYARYTSHDSVVRQNTFARSICADELESTYHNNDNPCFNFVIVCSTIIVPFVTLILIVFSIRNVDYNTIKSFTDSANHETMVALVLTGKWVTIGIFICDVKAYMVVKHKEHEYSKYINGKPINLQITLGTLICDAIFILPMLLCILYIVFPCCIRNRNTVHSFLKKCFFCIIGIKNNNKKFISDNDIICLMFPLMLTTPLLCISSHIGYIMLAWLTEPSKCTTMAIMYYSLLLLIFFILRKAYKIQSKRVISLPKACNKESNQQDETPLFDVTAIASSNEQDTPIQSDYNADGNRHMPEQAERCIYCVSISNANEEHYNAQAFCLLILYGAFIVGIGVIFVLIFILLPLASEELVRYLFELFQLSVVLVSGLITYKLFSRERFTFESVVKKFKDAYATKEGSNEKLKAIASKHEDLAAIAGEFGAELTDVIIKNN